MFFDLKGRSVMVSTEGPERNAFRPERSERKSLGRNEVES
jgi:hypothetical protein